VLPNLILENENPAARFLGGIDVRAGLCRKHSVCAEIARQAAKSKGFPYPTGVRWLSASRKPAQVGISAPGFPSVPVTLT
jgi:hypothetical protein